MAVGGMDLNLLVALRALLEEVNVTRAGQRINMSQPAMSTALAKLRRHYRDELLVRVGREYELTPLARSMLPAIQRSMPKVAAALDLRDDFDPATSGRAFTIALSDYALTVLNGPLMRCIASRAPGVAVDMSPVPPDMHVSDRGLLRFDFLVGPLGYGFHGKGETLFRDRFVCVVDPHNKRLADGSLSLRDFEALPHASATFGPNLTPIDHALSLMGVVRNIRVSTVGWLPLPFAVAGTDLVAVLPELLARQVSQLANVTVAEPPFGHVDIVEALWWHPTREMDPGHRWLLAVLRECSASIADPLRPYHPGLTRRPATVSASAPGAAQNGSATSLNDR
jgi:DNA-binding transcriptional LysR family regulator